MILFRQYAVTAAAVDLGTALSLTTTEQLTKYNRIILKYAEASVNVAFMGGSNVTAVPANAGYQFPTGAGVADKTLILGGYGRNNILDVRDIFLIGTANAANVFFITLER